ncbi:hypothetical protein RR48_15439 [Papilio machaon]|uniref:Uncharacterized protein n=1 Tax=Papilio machaon TaxID=76193 RepID=A0A194QUU0_PAPMA|nr:hypothetical protein RR48_15439 [Papilio machaon]
MTSYKSGLIFYTNPQVLDPRCDCSTTDELLARFMSQSLSTVIDPQPIGLQQNDYERAATYPIKLIPYLVKKPIPRVPFVKNETQEIKINKNTSLNCKAFVRRSKIGKCKRQSSKIDKVVGKHKNYTVQYKKNNLKVTSDIRKPDLVLQKFEGINNNTDPVKSTVHLPINSNVSLSVNDSVTVQEKHGYVDYQENKNAVIEGISKNFTDENIKEITLKKHNDNFKELSSQLTTNKTDNIFVTKNKKPTNENDTESFVLKFNNDVMSTIHNNSMSTTNKISENNEYTISTTPSYNHNNSMIILNKINRKKYNESEITLQKIITKELTNGSVISKINGTENLESNEFMDENISDNIFSKTNITLADFKNVTPPEPIIKSTKNVSQKTPIVFTTLNFIFVHYIQNKLEEESAAEAGLADCGMIVISSLILSGLSKESLVGFAGGILLLSMTRLATTLCAEYT